MDLELVIIAMIYGQHHLIQYFSEEKWHAAQTPAFFVRTCASPNLKDSRTPSPSGSCSVTDPNGSVREFAARTLRFVCAVCRSSASSVKDGVIQLILLSTLRSRGNALGRSWLLNIQKEHASQLITVLHVAHDFFAYISASSVPVISVICSF